MTSPSSNFIQIFLLLFSFSAMFMKKRNVYEKKKKKNKQLFVFPRKATLPPVEKKRKKLHGRLLILIFLH